MIITNGKIITWGSANRIEPEGLAILVRNGVIEAIDQQDALIASHPQEDQIDAEGQYVMPGNICAHTHFYGAFSRGLAIPGAPAENFIQILQKLWWHLDKALDQDGVYFSTQVCLIDAIKHGTTTLIDHHASPNFIDGSLDVIADAINAAGLRASLCYEVTDRDGAGASKKGLRENVRFIDRIKARHPAEIGRAHV